MTDPSCFLTLLLLADHAAVSFLTHLLILSFFFFPHLLLELSPGTYSTLARRQAHCQRRGSDPPNCSTELGPLTLGGRSDQTEPRGGNPQLPQL